MLTLVKPVSLDEMSWMSDTQIHIIFTPDFHSVELGDVHSVICQWIVTVVVVDWKGLKKMV